jgi:glycosyltransferase involved in cell wall biosynthesis
MNPASVSVVIPTWNSAALVTQAIDSVLAQTVLPAEVIVIDDGSSDDTAARLTRYPGQVRYCYQANQGVSAARNRGLAEARGEWIAFLDADDVWHPRKLELQLQALAQRSEVGLLGTQVFDWPAPAFPKVTVPVDPIQVVPWERLVVKNYFTTSSVLVRRALFERVGGFDTRLQGPEDHDRWLHIAEQAVVANLALPLTGYRCVSGSLSKQARRMQAGMTTILQKLDDRGAWGGRHWLRRKAYSYLHYSCAYMHSTAGHHGAALWNMLQSFAWYPLAYQRGEVRMPLARAKILGAILLHWLRSVGVKP